MSAIITLRLYNCLRSLGYSPTSAWKRALRASS